MGGSILGGAVKRTEDPRFITGAGGFLSNERCDGALWLVPVRSTVPHGAIDSIDVTEARSQPGVVEVLVADDLAYGPMPTGAPGQPEETRRPLIASDRVRFVGDIFAVVVAESALQAVDAAELVWADIEALPAVSSAAAALTDGAPLLFPELGTNVVLSGGLESDVDPLAGADLVVRTRVVNQRLAALPLEANAALAVPRPDGLDLWVGTQNVFTQHRVVAEVLGLDPATLRVRVPDMGGGFGAKIGTYPEQVLVAAVALRTGRPARWHETRRENMVGMGHGRGQEHDIALGARTDGTITGLRISSTQDAGAYPGFGAYLPSMTQRMASGPYAIPAIDFRWKSVVTNTTPIDPYRGAGRPEAALSLERAMDLLAGELNLDPVEVRRRNLHPADAFPLHTATGERYDTGEYGAALDLALDLAGYEGLRTEQAERRRRGDRLQLGIGVSTYVEVTAPLGRRDWGSVEVDSDGAVTVASGSSSHGQGHATTFAQIAAHVLKVPLDLVTVVQGDTGRVALGGGTMGSRSHQLGGAAVSAASEAVVEKARRLASHLLEASLDDIVQFDDGRIGVAGVPDSGISLSELASIAIDPSRLPEGMETGLAAAHTYTQEHATVPFGTHISVVEVDTETGEVIPRRHVACDDCGTILNRAVVDGQVHGGVVQGIGQAWFERVSYDEAANPLSASLAAYVAPTAASIPTITVAHTVTPTTESPLGGKGIGEAGTIGSIPAAVNAVHDAVRHLGISSIDPPLTPATVWAALQSVRS